MQLNAYVKLRPYAYHLTALSNLVGIRKERRLYPAARGLASAKVSVGARRAHHVEVELAGFSVHIRDQAPLYAGNCDLGGGWDFATLVTELNERVFFWPGGDEPIAYGLRHYERYKQEKPRIIRVAVDDLLNANPTISPDVCKYNSGSPRCSNGSKSPRGPDTFVPLGSSTLTPSQVVELTFRGPVALPDTAQVASTPTGPWRKLL